MQEAVQDTDRNVSVIADNISWITGGLGTMSVTDLASYRRDDRSRHLALWRAFSGVYVDLCEGGFCDYDPKTLRRLWEDYCADMPAALRARAMMGELG